MFGGLGSRPKLLPRPRIRTTIIRGGGAYNFGHMAPNPNSRYIGRAIQYEQRKRECKEKREESDKKKKGHRMFVENYRIHREKLEFRRDFDTRYEKQLKDFGDTVKQRREKLSNLFAIEEQEYIREMTESVRIRRGEVTEQLKHKVFALRDREEADRLEIVKERRLQQYINKSEELRTMLTQQRLMESKEIQQAQMRENESRKQSEQELEHMWHLMTLKDIEAKKEREKQDELWNKMLNDELKQFADVHANLLVLQKDKEKLKLEQEKQRLNKLREEEEHEKQAVIEKKRRLREETISTIRDNEETQRKKAEHAAKEAALSQTYAEVLAEELRKDKAKIQEKVSSLKNELDTFKLYVTQTKKERGDEERRVHEIVNEVFEAMQRKQDEEACKTATAKRTLQKDVLKQLAEQINYRREKEIQDAKKREEEIKCNKILGEQNDRLREELQRKKKLAILKYREDLDKQIQYSKLLKQREEMEERRAIQAGEDEQKQLAILQGKILSHEIKYDIDHPFRKALNKYPTDFH